MNPILRLYPRAWRDRYLDEVAELLRERPPGPRDQVDLLLGALDAWIHPQVSRSASAAKDDPIVRPIGILVLGVVAGSMWVIGGVLQATASYNLTDGLRESRGTMLVLFATVVSAIAALARGWSSLPTTRALRRAAVAMLPLSLLILGGWPLLVVGYWGHLVATIAFGALLAGVGQRTGAPLAAAALVAVFFNTESALAFAAVPIGVAWIVVSLESVVRRPVRTRAVAA